MKFNCGPDKKTEYEINCVKAKERAAYLREWHDFFALIPRRVGNYDCRWLETIQRRYPRAEAFGDSVGFAAEDRHREFRAKPT